MNLVIRASLAAATLAAVAVVPGADAASWSKSVDWKAADIDANFNYFTGKDPTNGLVVYQSQSQAQAANLSYVRDSQFVLRADTVATALEGRRSVRIQSKQQYSDGVYVLNVSHVPTGCAVWPAFWTVQNFNGTPWPAGGEIDILENANDQFPSNLVSLHTASNCTIPTTSSTQTGSVSYNQCYAYGPQMTGCRIAMNGTSTPTWGQALNQAGGGTFAMERALGSTGQGIRVWYWPKGQEPSDLAATSNAVDPSAWGKPGAQFPVASCSKDFGPHYIIMNIDIGGDWPFGTYNQTPCAATYGPITNQVAYNGSSFSEAYWSVGGLRLFTNGGGNDNAANSPYTGPANSAVSGSASSASSTTYAAAKGVAAAYATASMLVAGLGLLLF